jgi:hypothetical protein
MQSISLALTYQASKGLQVPQAYCAVKAGRPEVRGFILRMRKPL